MRTYEGLIFDFDGVITLSEHARFDVLRRSATSHGSAIEDHLFTAMRGITTSDFLNDFLPGMDEEIRQRVLADYAREYRGKIAEHAVPIAETTEFIRSYQGAVPLAVASASEKLVLDTMLTNIGIKDKFSHIFGKEHVTRHKPHPEVYNRAIEAIGVPAKSCAIVEDSVSGARAGIAAKAGVYIFLNGLNGRTEFDDLPIEGFLVTKEQIAELLK